MEDVVRVEITTRGRKFLLDEVVADEVSTTNIRDFLNKNDCWEEATSVSRQIPLEFGNVLNFLYRVGPTRFLVGDDLSTSSRTISDLLKKGYIRKVKDK